MVIRDFGALHKEGRCIKCFKSFSEREVVFHLAIEHHKVNDALRKDGFNMLLSQIKAEPYDLKERVNNMITTPEAPLEENKEDGGGKEADMDEDEDEEDADELENVPTEKYVENEENDDSEEEAFCCELCGIEESEIERLWKHYIVAHKEIRNELVKEYCPSIAKLKCDLCGNRRNSEERLVTHVGIVHLKLNEILRGKKLATLKLMKRHKSLLMGGNNADLAIKAEEDSIFKSIEADIPKINVNESEKEPKRIPSLIEDQQRPTEPSIHKEREVNTKIAKSAIKCQICNETMTSLSKLWLHYCDHKEIRTGIFDTFKSKSKTNFKCDICGNLTKDLIAKVKHVAIVHEMLNKVLQSKGLEEIKKMKFKDEFSIGLGYLANSKKQAEKEFIQEQQPKNEEKAKEQQPEVANEQEPEVRKKKEPKVRKEKESEVRKEKKAELEVSEEKETKSQADGNEPVNKDKSARGSTQKCKLCLEDCQNGTMKQHYIIRHFLADFKKHDSEIHKKKKCNICGKVCSSVRSAYLHYGVKHGGLDKILRKKAMLDGKELSPSSRLDDVHETYL